LLSTRLDWDHPGDLLATSMERLQFYDRGRVTSMGDVYADSLGATVGAVTAAFLDLACDGRSRGHCEPIPRRPWCC
jgi:hypothetical protein